ncbi:hypothetical protein [Streptomyces sp. NPDC054975]
MFVRRQATAGGWKGDVEGAARAIGVAATIIKEPTQLGLAVGEDGALLVEIEDAQRGSTTADQVIASFFQHLTGAQLYWSDTSTDRAARAALPVRRVERVGGPA